MVLCIAGVAAAQAPAAQAPTAQTFHVFLRGAEAGSEEVTVFGSADGWVLRGSGKLGAPLNLTTEYWEIRYDTTWRPVDLTVSDEYFAEQFPLSPLDDYPIHQTPDPIRLMWSGDPRALNPQQPNAGRST